MGACKRCYSTSKKMMKRKEKRKNAIIAVRVCHSAASPRGRGRIRSALIEREENPRVVAAGGAGGADGAACTGLASKQAWLLSAAPHAPAKRKRARGLACVQLHDGVHRRSHASLRPYNSPLEPSGISSFVPFSAPCISHGADSHPPRRDGHTHESRGADMKVHESLRCDALAITQPRLRMN